MVHGLLSCDFFFAISHAMLLFASTTHNGQEGSQHTSSVQSILQLVKKLMERANQPRTALMLPAIVYAHLVLLDMANVRGNPTQL